MTEAVARQYALAAGVSAHRSAKGCFLLSERPLRALRVNEALLRLLGGVEAGVAAGPAAGATGPFAVSFGQPSSLEPLLERLCETGWLERSQPILEEESLPSVTVIVPVKDRERCLARCLASLSDLDYPSDRLEVVVVDDGSADRSREVAAAWGARVIETGGAGLGPGAARNRGAQAAGGDILAFLDSDCVATATWLRDLVGEFVWPDTAAVGGLVLGLESERALDRYEDTMSSLNLGRRRQEAGAGEDTFYLPSCNLLVRTACLRGVGGFREDMRVGEDVDFTWRLRDSGGRLVYRPNGTVRHEHRATWRSFLLRRFQYGTSEASLQRRHPARRKVFSLPPVPLLLLALTLGAFTLMADAVAAGSGRRAMVAGALLVSGAAIAGLDGALTVMRSRRRGLPWSPATLFGARLRVTGSLGYYATAHLLRYHALWLVVALVLAAVLGTPAFLVPVLILGLGPAAVDWVVRRPDLGFVSFLPFYLTEHLSYGSGVFAGCLRARSFSSYLPVGGRKVRLLRG